MSDELTAQSIFDTVAWHLIKQGRPAWAKNGSGGCMYRTPDGLKCAIGCLIADDEYRPEYIRGRLARIAEMYKLNPAVLAEHPEGA